MAEADGDRLDLESITRYMIKTDNPTVGLEHVDSYVKRTKAAIGLSKAKAANVIAYILLGGLVVSLPLYIVALAIMPTGSYEQLALVFGKWYDVVAPLAGAIIGALFGMSLASRRSEDKG
jgi:hypothetical protein